MPRKKKNYKVMPMMKQCWILYSTNREHCFLDEIRLGYFGPRHHCGCKYCDPQLVAPKPQFTPPPDPGAAVLRENQK